MVCKECQEFLSEYIDGGLELGEQVNLERHLADCEPCRAVRDDLLQIVHFSQRLPLQSPSAAVWSRVQSGLEDLKPGAWSMPLRWWTRIGAFNFNLTLPQTIAAAAVLVIVLSIAVIQTRRGNSTLPAQTSATSALISPGDVTPLSKADLQQLESQIGVMSQAVEQRKNSWDPEVRNAYERNLLYVDQSLIECRHQLNDNPADDVSQELMLNAYREKVRLLASFENF